MALIDANKKPIGVRLDSGDLIYLSVYFIYIYILINLNKKNTQHLL
jgi:hypothetical protein